MSAEATPKRHPDKAFRPIADEGGLVVDPAAHDVKVLNPVGSRIYQLLDGKRSVDAIVETIAAEFDVDAKQARVDTDAFLKDLRDRDMIADGDQGEAS